MRGKQAFAKKAFAKRSNLKKGREKASKTAAVGVGTAVIEPWIGSAIVAAGLGKLFAGVKTQLGFERRLMANPKAAGLLAKKARGTKDASYFAEIAKIARNRAQRKKHAAFLKRRSATARKAIRMQNEIRAIDAREREKSRQKKKFYTKKKKQE